MAWIGVGAPGSVDKDTGVVEYANNLEFYNVPLGAMLRDLGLPIYVRTITAWPGAERNRRAI